MKTKLIIACFLLITTAFIYIYSDSEKAGLSMKKMFMKNLLYVLIFFPLFYSCSVQQKTDGGIKLQVAGLNSDVLPSVDELFSSIQFPWKRWIVVY